MNKIHVTKTYNQGIEKVFKTISNHSRFLSGGGLQCKMIKLGNDNPNGEGAIRCIVAPRSLSENRKSITEKLNLCYFPAFFRQKYSWRVFSC